MAESTLSIAKTELDERIAHYLGYSRTSTDWTTSQQADIDDARQYGLARFYNERDWHFLSPATTLTTTADDYDQDLPDDFGSLRDTFYFAADKGYNPLTVTSPGKISDMISDSDSSGIPRYAAIQPKSSDGTDGQRYEVLFYPPPDDSYTLTYRYNALQDDLSSSYPYPMGGMVHRNTLIEACLAAAEVQKNDEIGIHEQRYQECLQKSIKSDARVSPKNLGYNGDPSTTDTGSTPTRYLTYNGTLPS